MCCGALCIWKVYRSFCLFFHVVGVKQPPVEHLIDGKTFVFFSHTIKAQPENMPLLDAVLRKVRTSSQRVALHKPRNAFVMHCSC